MTRHRIIILIGVAVVIGFTGCAPALKGVAPTPEEQYARAKNQYDKEHYVRATEEFQKLIFNYPGVTMVDTAQFYLAMSYFNNREYELAAVEFGRLASNYPRSDFVDDAQYMAGICYIRNSPGHYALTQDDLKRGISILEDFTIDNPDSPLLQDAKNSIREAREKLARKDYSNGITYFKLYDYEAARIYFQKVIDDYSDTEYGARALFKMAESYYKEKKYRESQEKFGQFTSLYPDHEYNYKAEEYLDKISQKLKTENASIQSK